jgi:RES domain
VRIAASKLRRHVDRISGWSRIIARRYRASPTDTGFSSSRFSSPTYAFKVLYAASDFSTALAEAVIRDRFTGEEDRDLYQGEIEQLCLTTISSNRLLTLLDLRGAGAYEAGIDTDAKGARDHSKGQALSEVVHANMPEIDGILFESRLMNRPCIAIYDHAFAWLTATPPIDLLQSSVLVPELQRLGITLHMDRGIGP